MSKPTVFRYPLGLIDQNTDYVKIDAYEYRPPGINTPSDLQNFSFAQRSSDGLYDSLGTKEIRGTLLLPMPQNVPINTQSASWSEGRMGPGATLTLGVAQKTLESKEFVQSLGSSLVAAATGISKAAQTALGQKAFQSYFAAAAAQQLLGQDNLFNDVLGRSTGAVFNENIELLFRGLNLRAPFQLAFDLAPRDDKEALIIRNMVVFLKKEMSARKGTQTGGAAGLFLTAPSVFKVQYMSGGKPHPYLNKFKICALTDLGLNFTASNTYTTYSDGTPVHMNLGMTFQELTPIYNQDYPERNEIGVGY